MKNILNEELNSIKYLFDYQRGKVISEQTTYYMGADGKLGVLQGPYRLPDGAKALTQQEYELAGGIISQMPVKIEKEVVVKIPESKTDAVKIQEKLISLGKDIGPTGVDGKVGPNTAKAIWEVIKDL